jgi:hypothetical protein
MMKQGLLSSLTRSAVEAPQAPPVDPAPDVFNAPSTSAPVPPTGQSEARAPKGPGRGGRLKNLRGGDGPSLDLRGTWQVVVGAILVPLGVMFILFAWYGAAHTRYVQQQIPYLVSGDFIGLGCMLLGGLLYWSHGLYRIYDQADLHHEEQLRAMEQTLRAIADRLPGTTEVTSTTGTAALPGSFFVTPGGSAYHLASCPVVSHHHDQLQAVSASLLGSLKPCGICLPNA